MTEQATPPLLVFSDDWGRHPSSCQHLVRELLPRYQVRWVNTIGMRSPSLNVATFTRGVEKLNGWFKPAPNPCELPANLRVVDPAMWPWLRSRASRRLNRALLLRTLLPIIEGLGAPPVAITTLPVTADLMEYLPVAHWVYYCVDDFSQWPGLDQRSISAMEEMVVRSCDRLIAVSETLQERLQKMGRRAELLTHGVATHHWQAPADVTAMPLLKGLERPFVVFWGLIDRRLDLRFVRAMAARLTKGTILFAGPEVDADPALWAIPRVRRLGAISYEELPRLAAEADVLVMPYADLPVTRAMQPLKLKEYIATGRPVVVRDLPATRTWVDCVDVEADAGEFAATVCRRIRDGLPPNQLAARARLVDESWEAKAKQFEQWAICSSSDSSRSFAAAR